MARPSLMLSDFKVNFRGFNCEEVRQFLYSISEEVEALVKDILDEIQDVGDNTALKSRLDAILSRVACHGSIRSGRQMRGEEMNALLREMEATPHSGQCNHGRPTYVELKLADIERLFGRR